MVGGIQAQKAADVQATQDQQQARVAMENAGAQESATSENAAKTISRAEAGAGAAGITAASAAPVLSEDYTQAKIKTAYERFGGKLASTEDVYQGQIAKYEGQQAFWGGIFGGANALLKGASSIGGIGLSQGWGTSAPGPGGGSNTSLADAGLE